MSVLSTDIKLFKSASGAALSLGGAITATEIVSSTLNNLFDIVSSTESRDGDIEYRCFYVRNTNTSFTLQAAAIQIVSDTASLTTRIAIGLGSSFVGGVEQSVADEETAPIGVTFTNVEGNVLNIGNIPPNSFKAVWVRRTVNAGTAAATSDASTLRITGETTA